MSAYQSKDKASPTATANQPRNSDQSLFLRSRDTPEGSVTSSVRQNAAAIASRPAPVAKSWAHFVAGGLGGMTAATVTAPLDVLKTRFQSDFYQSQLRATRSRHGISPHAHLSPLRSGLLHLRETFQILFSVRRVEGWRALFRGLGPNLAAIVPARSINFYTYGNGKRLVADRLNGGREASWVHLLAAAASGVAQSTVTNPIWVVKTRLQLDKSGAVGKKTVAGAGTGIGAGTVAARRQYRNAFDCARQIVQQEGVGGLYRGLTASFAGVSENVLQWVMYEQMKSYLRRREGRIAASGRPKTTWDETVEWTGKVGAAGGAKFIAAIITYPHEVVRTRLRQEPVDGVRKYTGLIQTFKLVWKQEGLVSMYGGLTPHLLRTVPSAAITFGMYEAILRMLDTPA